MLERRLMQELVDRRCRGPRRNPISSALIRLPTEPTCTPLCSHYFQTGHSFRGHEHRNSFIRCLDLLSTTLLYLMLSRRSRMIPNESRRRTRGETDCREFFSKSIGTDRFFFTLQIFSNVPSIQDTVKWLVPFESQFLQLD